MKSIIRNYSLACLLGVVFMAILDVAVANIALPSIQHSLHTSGALLQLVTAGYIAAYAVLLIPAARLGARFGYRRMFMLGLCIFTATSLLCGTAPYIAVLVGARIAQGAGAALFMPQVLSIIQRDFTGHERAQALSLYATVIAGSAIIGQILGGVLVADNLFGWQWRPIFLINVPIGALLLAMSWRVMMPDTAWRRKTSLDIRGASLFLAALLALVLPITLGRELGWPSWIWVCLTAGFVALLLFVAIERRTEKNGGHSLVHSRIVQVRGFTVGTLAILIAMGGYGGILFLLSLYIQNGLGYGPLAAGLAFLPSAVAFGVASLQWRKLPARWHPLLPSVGLLTAGMGLFGLALSTRYHGITLGMEGAILLFGLGMGLAFSPLFTASLAYIQPGDAADASGILATANQLGQVLGVVIYGALLLAVAHTHGLSYAATVTAVVMAACDIVAAIVVLNGARNV